MKNKKLYIAYGSNLNLERMAHRCPTARPVGKVELNDYQLLFRGGRGGSVATVEPIKGKSVPCLLWEITPTDEAALDRYEGYPYLYRKETIKAKFGKEDIEAMIYIMNEGYHLNSPSLYYYSIILDGYKSADFDTNILKQAVEGSKENENG